MTSASPPPPIWPEPTSWPHAAATPEACYHGGAFFDAIGDGFDDLGRRRDIIPADVLDAWFAPAPAVVEALRAHLDWIVRTSPPTNGEGLVRAIARARGIPASAVGPGGGAGGPVLRPPDPGIRKAVARPPLYPPHRAREAPADP